MEILVGLPKSWTLYGLDQNALIVFRSGFNIRREMNVSGWLYQTWIDFVVRHSQVAQKARIHRERRSLKVTEDARASDGSGLTSGCRQRRRCDVTANTAVADTRLRSGAASCWVSLSIQSRCPLLSHYEHKPFSCGPFLAIMCEHIADRRPQNRKYITFAAPAEEPSHSHMRRKFGVSEICARTDIQTDTLITIL